MPCFLWKREQDQIEPYSLKLWLADYIRKRIWQPHRTNETKWGFRHGSNSHFRKGRLGNNQKRLLAMLHLFFATQKLVNFTWPCSPSLLSIWSMIRRPTWRWSRYNRDWNEEEETDFLEHHEPPYAHHQPFCFLRKFFLLSEENRTTTHASSPYCTDYRASNQLTVAAVLRLTTFLLLGH